MSGIADTDFLAAVMALADAGPRARIQTDEVSRLLGVEYPSDIAEDLFRLAERGLLALERNNARVDGGQLESSVLDDQPHRNYWSITVEGRLEVYRR